MTWQRLSIIPKLTANCSVSTELSWPSSDTTSLIVRATKTNTYNSQHWHVPSNYIDRWTWHHFVWYTLVSHQVQPLQINPGLYCITLQNHHSHILPRVVPFTNCMSSAIEGTQNLRLLRPATSAILTKLSGNYLSSALDCDLNFRSYEPPNYSRPLLQDELDVGSVPHFFSCLLGPSAFRTLFV